MSSGMTAGELAPLYHTTPAEKLSEVLRTGLVLRGGRLYLTPYQDDARSLAGEMSERAYHGRSRQFVLLEVGLPEDTPLYEDPDVWGSDIFYYVRRIVGPEGIKVVHSFEV